VLKNITEVRMFTNIFTCEKTLILPLPACLIAAPI